MGALHGWHGAWQRELHRRMGWGVMGTLTCYKESICAGARIASYAAPFNVRYTAGVPGVESPPYCRTAAPSFSGDLGISKLLSPTVINERLFKNVSGLQAIPMRTNNVRFDTGADGRMYLCMQELCYVKRLLSKGSLRGRDIRSALTYLTYLSTNRAIYM